MSGNARMLEEEMIQNIRDKKMKPSVADNYALTAFFAAAEVKYHIVSFKKLLTNQRLISNSG